MEEIRKCGLKKGCGTFCHMIYDCSYCTMHTHERCNFSFFEDKHLLQDRTINICKEEHVGDNVCTFPPHRASFDNKHALQDITINFLSVLSTKNVL